MSFYLVNFPSIVVAIVCSFRVKNSNPRPKAKFFHKVGMVSEDPGRGGVATRSVHGCPPVMFVLCHNTPRSMTTHLHTSGTLNECRSYSLVVELQSMRRWLALVCTVLNLSVLCRLLMPITYVIVPRAADNTIPSVVSSLLY